ncbi:MAG: hypothetical protein RDV48_22890 [Candidatus Eremiobacteraeota bacterium]|nr:hypothetical protein [Candidatus Eremiobacteraeota bacterium]
MLQGENAPATSETGHMLLDICLDVLEGRADKEKLAEAIEKTRGSLGEMQADFQKTSQEQPPQIQQECQRETEQAMECFAAYYEALDVLEQFFRTGDKFDIVRGAEKVRGASGSMNDAFLAYRNRALVAMGPTSIPILNLVLSTFNSLNEASQEELPAWTEKLQTIIEREYIVVHRAMAELNRQNLIPEEELLKKAYEAHQQACADIRSGIKNQDNDVVKAGIDNYTHAAERIMELIPAVNLKRMTQMPTTSPQANLVINLSMTLGATAESEEMFLEALKTLEDNFLNTKMQFEAVRRNPVDSVLVKEEMENAVKALTTYEGAIADYYRFLEVRDTLLLAQAASKLTEGVKQLQATSEIFQSISEREGKTPCIRCSHYNPSDRKTCEKCGAVLPASAEMLQPARTFELDEQDEHVEGRAPTEEITMTENIYKVFDAVNKVSEGHIAIEEFTEIVNELELLVVEGRKAYGPLPQVNLDSLKGEQREQAIQIKEMLEEAKEVFREGTDDILTGISFFRQYIQQGDKNNLIAGVQIIWQGVGKLQKVQKATELLKKAQEEAQKK